MDDVVIKSFTTLLEANLAVNLLASEGIKGFARTKAAATGVGLPSDSLGADLVVLQKDAERARDILANSL